MRGPNRRGGCAAEVLPGTLALGGHLDARLSMDCLVVLLLTLGGRDDSLRHSFEPGHALPADDARTTDVRRPLLEHGNTR